MIVLTNKEVWKTELAWRGRFQTEARAFARDSLQEHTSFKKQKCSLKGAQTGWNIDC
jgi:hypothetical protein